MRRSPDEAREASVVVCVFGCMLWLLLISAGLRSPLMHLPLIAALFAAAAYVWLALRTFPECAHCGAEILAAPIREDYHEDVWCSTDCRDADAEGRAEVYARTADV